MTRCLYWFAKSACWSCSWGHLWCTQLAGLAHLADPEPAWRGRLQRSEKKVVNILWLTSHYRHQFFFWNSCQSPVRLCGRLDSDRNTNATDPGIVSWEQLIRATRFQNFTGNFRKTLRMCSLLGVECQRHAPILEGQ